MDDAAIARWRLHTQRLAGQRYPSAPAVVEGLLGVQAENFAQALWAVGTRTSGATAASVRQLCDDGEILRTHVLRPTWHFVRPDDLRWLLELTAPRARGSIVRQQAQHGLDDHALARSANVIAEALASGLHLTREAVTDHLRAAGLPAGGTPVGLMLMSAELDGLICSGRMRAGEQTFALLDERAPNCRRLQRDEALAEVSLRYFTGHGPATERDLAYWATLTLRDVRAGIAAVADRLDRFEHDGRTYWFATPPPPQVPVDPRAHLLQILDEYYRGYQDSRLVLDAARIVPRGRERSLGMVLVDGQMAGTMRRTVHGSVVTFHIGPFRDLGADEVEAVHQAAGRYGEFLDTEARVIITCP